MFFVWKRQMHVKSVKNIQYTLRKQRVRLRKQEKSNQEIVRIVGATERYAIKIWQQYVRESSESLKFGQGGHRNSVYRKLVKGF